MNTALYSSGITLVGLFGNIQSIHTVSAQNQSVADPAPALGEGSDSVVFVFC